MSVTASRLLSLLGRLQSRADWTGTELADELGVTTRTIRKDIDRLRGLGYSIEAQAGQGGGYRFGRSRSLPPLLLDDDEAVALAVSLWTGANGTIAGVEESSVRALAKLDQVLPSHLRRRVRTLQDYTASTGSGGPALDPDLLVAISAACRDAHELQFLYRTHSGDTARRAIEPHQLVHFGRFWYVVGWDRERDAWRTFRLDRLAGRLTPGRGFARRTPPDGGFAAHVARGRSAARDRWQAEILLHAPQAELAQRVPPHYGTLEPVGEDRCLLRAGADWLGALAVNVALLGVDFEVLSPPELADQVDELAERFLRARSTDRGR